MRALWLQNLKRFVTGTIVGGKYALDVNVTNSITASLGSAAFKEARFHDAGVTNIPARTGTWVQLDANSDVAGSTPANVANSCTAMLTNWNGSGALQIGKGANSGAVSVIEQIGSGQTVTTSVSLASGDKLWVRAVQNAALTNGELTVKLLG
jgi:hypothetical protein